MSRWAPTTLLAGSERAGKGQRKTLLSQRREGRKGRPEEVTSLWGADGASCG